MDKIVANIVVLLIETIENGTITNQDMNIDTSILGNKDIAIKYQNERKKELNI